MVSFLIQWDHFQGIELYRATFSLISENSKKSSNWHSPKGLSIGDHQEAKETVS